MVIEALCHAVPAVQERRPDWLTKTALVMKLTGILLLAAVVHVSARTAAQTVTYSAKTTPLVSVFAAIEQQTGYVFFYNSRDLQEARPVTVQLEKTPLKEALERILATQPVTFDIQGNTIAITRKTKFTDVGVNTDIGAAPPGEIHGHISDSVGRPLVGANVQIKGDKHGVQTDQNGEFVLRNVADNATLIISNVGYETQTIKLTGGRVVRIALKQSMSTLDETVVKGYYSTTNRLNTGDVTTVKGEDIAKQPVSDPIQTLEARVPGLYIQQTSGAPGAYAQIQIRGQNSIANGNDPLYIVDGVPFGSVSLSSPDGVVQNALGIPSGSTANLTGGNGGGGMSPFNSLNPGDIESIIVLKDADATAIYGSRGANGVILITTKRGKAGNTKLDLNVYTGVSSVARMMHLLNTTQYLMMRKEGFANDSLSVPSIATNPSDADYDVDGVWDTTRYTNWQKVLIGNSASFTNAQANLSGGNANTQFIIGAGFNRQGTVFPGTYSDQKASGHFNLTHVSADQHFHIQFSSSYVYDKSDLPEGDFTGNINLAPDAPALYNSDGSLNWQVLSGTATWNNPLAATLAQSNSNVENLISNLTLDYTIVKGLDFKSSFGYNHSLMNQLVLTPATTYAPPNNDIASNRRNATATSDVSGWIVEPQVSYQQKIAKGNLNIIFGSKGLHR